MRALGRKQQQIIIDMAVYGGRVPIRFRLAAANVEVLKSLRRRGLVTTANMWSKLTPEGQMVAEKLMMEEGR